jgi:hypothetical protein
MFYTVRPGIGHQYSTCTDCSLIVIPETLHSNYSYSVRYWKQSRGDLKYTGGCA